MGGGNTQDRKETGKHSWERDRTQGQGGGVAILFCGVGTKQSSRCKVQGVKSPVSGLYERRQMGGLWYSLQPPNQRVEEAEGSGVNQDLS